MKIGVPFSQYEKVERAVVEAFGGDTETKALLWPSEEDRPEYTALTNLSFEQKGQGQRGQISAADFAETSDDDPEEDTDHRSELPNGIMFCPLCLGEYRRGFVECSDCGIALMTTQTAARAKLWKHAQQPLLEQLSAALEAAQIPRPPPLPRRHRQPSTDFWHCTRKKSLDIRIRNFRSPIGLAKARAIVEELLSESPED